MFWKKLETKIDGIDKTTKETKIEFNHRLGKVESCLEDNTKKLGDLEESVNYAHEDIQKQKERMGKIEEDAKDLRKKLNAGQQKIKQMEDELKKVKIAMAEGLNAQERRTRDYNIRLRGVAAEKLRGVNDCRQVVADILVKNDLVPTKEVGDVIKQMEIAHPLGKPLDGKVNIIYLRPAK